MESTEILLTVIDSSKHVVCQTTTGVRAALIATPHMINLAACPSLPGNKYSITITDPDRDSADMLYNTQMINQGTFQSLNSVQISRTDSSKPFQAVGTNATNLYVLYDFNPEVTKGTDDTSCQMDASPLVLDTTPFVDNGQGLPLSSPADGVMFDILGANSFPSPHAKKQISWFHQATYMFLVLPDSNGQVTGVDQLFGNNTTGPDGKFAANGFKALGKYDANGDGVIDRRDPVFSQLRLWSDVNADGVAQPAELRTLSDLGITQIDVRYNRHFSEEDQYGNITRFNSLVHYLDGTLRQIFDVWFAIN